MNCMNCMNSMNYVVKYLFLRINLHLITKKLYFGVFLFDSGLIAVKTPLRRGPGS